MKMFKIMKKKNTQQGYVWKQRSCIYSSTFVALSTQNKKNENETREKIVENVDCIIYINMLPFSWWPGAIAI